MVAVQCGSRRRVRCRWRRKVAVWRARRGAHRAAEQCEQQVSGSRMAAECARVCSVSECVQLTAHDSSIVPRCVKSKRMPDSDVYIQTQIHGTRSQAPITRSPMRRPDPCRGKQNENCVSTKSTLNINVVNEFRVVTTGHHDRGNATQI